ncbi:MAG: TM0106 family RecB-like putative nuclease [Deltaproteobacteria bacterium]|nr:TM0106 family RecB-like putative nuclease [Deltaproteobacteria bacterium]
MITSEVTVAYTQCKLKAYLLLFTDKKSTRHGYTTTLEEKARKNRAKYFNKIKMERPEAEHYFSDGMRRGTPILLEAILSFDDMKAYADAIAIIGETSSKKTYSYAPTLVVGTHKISKEQKFQLAFIGYVLSHFQKEKPVSGTIIGSGNNVQKIKIEVLYKEVGTVLKNLKTWTQNSNMEPPPIILNKHCLPCPFQKDCEVQAIEKDDLSLLSRMSPKAIQKYQKKGIFTINQLSYLFRPRKQRKGKKKTKIPLRYRLELQALAIRTEKIYIKELPEISRHEVELFLDIEGIPDQDFYYLIGLLVSKGEEQVYYFFWAGSINEEQKIWNNFIEKANEYPYAPIYHYGGYDSKAIHQLKNRYRKNSETVEERLNNVNSFIYGKVYFPVRSNSLKELGKSLGAVWSHPEASGLQSLVWRYRWDENQNDEYKQLLLTYNEEDCKALCLLTKELSKIIETADSKSNIDFADQPKKHATNIGSQIHEELEKILKYAHADYDKKKIIFQKEVETKAENDKKNSPLKGRIGHYKKRPKTKKVIRVARRRKCPQHRGKDLKICNKAAERVVIDLVLTKNGIRKSITKYCGTKSYCSKCDKYYNPPAIDKLNNELYGHNFRSWAIYYRVYLRLPYSAIVQIFQNQFNEKISDLSIVKFIKKYGNKYSPTEKLNIKKILESPFIHADETTINIQGEVQYVWVFTDGKHVVFRKTETREASIVHEFLANYTGILISDFYPGYDSVKCRQQKCWSHLIRDINDDLWKEPFNEELELFVLEVKSLIVPMLQTIQKYGSKKRHLNKFKKSVDLFYKKNIDNQAYRFEVTIKYQKRFQRYRDSLFIFLEDDGIPWNNNMAERAIRHLAVQRKISGFFFDSLVLEYLLLLGIAQSCRFQDKPFLKFLLSQKKDVDLFKTPKPKKKYKIRDTITGIEQNASPDPKPVPFFQ